MNVRHILCGLIPMFLLNGAGAGPLDPPGAPGSTPGPPVVVSIPAAPTFPVVISSPGIYTLSGNLTSSASSLIVIDAPDVTLDLNGHVIFSSGNIGIEINADRVTVQNGRLVGPGTVNFNVSQGINTADKWHTTITNVEIVDHPFGGIRGSGAHTTVSNCRVYSIFGTGIGGVGIQTGDAARIIDTEVSHCTEEGINTGWASLVENCRVMNCGRNIMVKDGSEVRNCMTRGGNIGIYATYYCLIQDNFVSAHTGDGILMFGLGRIEGNHINYIIDDGGFGTGISTGAEGGTEVVGNSVTSVNRGIDLSSGDGHVFYGNIFRRCPILTFHNFDTANNFIGPIINRTTGGSPTIYTNIWE